MLLVLRLRRREGERAPHRDCALPRAQAGVVGADCGAPLRASGCGRVPRAQGLVHCCVVGARGISRHGDGHGACARECVSTGAHVRAALPSQHFTLALALAIALRRRRSGSRAHDFRRARNAAQPPLRSSSQGTASVSLALPPARTLLFSLIQDELLRVAGARGFVLRFAISCTHCVSR